MVRREGEGVACHHAFDRIESVGELYLHRMIEKRHRGQQAERLELCPCFDEESARSYGLRGENRAPADGVEGALYGKRIGVFE